MSVQSKRSLKREKRANGTLKESLDEARDFISETIRAEKGTRFEFCFSKKAKKIHDYAHVVPLLRSSKAREELLREFAAGGYDVLVLRGPNGDYAKLPATVLHWDAVSWDALDTFIIEI